MSNCKTYDSIGLLAAVIIRGEILLQNLWKLKIGWDDPVPQDVQATWFKQQ